MPINHLVVVLGKRLQNSALTAEGRSRVIALSQYVASHANSHMAVGFCGGITANQSRSEADVMYQYYQELMLEQRIASDIVPVLLERKSTSTVENIRHLAQELIRSRFVEPSAQVTVTFVSNDYHLERIFEIQALLDEQGLLRTLKQACLAAGVEILIPPQLGQHICVPYPDTTPRGQLFLSIEALTTYRVYLEGVIGGNIERDLTAVRAEPLAIALHAIAQTRAILTLEGDDEHQLVLRQLLPVIEQCVLLTTPDKSKSQIRPWLACMDTNLTMLNRMLDPESDLDSWWWR